MLIKNQLSPQSVHCSPHIAAGHVSSASSAIWLDICRFLTRKQHYWVHGALEGSMKLKGCKSPVYLVKGGMGWGGVGGGEGGGRVLCTYPLAVLTRPFQPPQRCLQGWPVTPKVSRRIHLMLNGEQIKHITKHIIKRIIKHIIIHYYNSIGWYVCRGQLIQQFHIISE